MDSDIPEDGHKGLNPTKTWSSCLTKTTRSDSFTKSNKSHQNKTFEEAQDNRYLRLSFDLPMAAVFCRRTILEDQWPLGGCKELATGSHLEIGSQC